uniref:AXH domain-containing protein n=1 Tax=Macrostomum lignano TaxID=282301 RepID=A0A1I8GDY7_9PLAT
APLLPQPRYEDGVRQQPETASSNSALFRRGTLVTTGAGAIKRVEDLSLADFDGGGNSRYRLERCRVARAEDNPPEGTVRLEFTLGQDRRQVRKIELPISQPFYVADKGWASHSPTKTMERHGLPCQRLEIGDSVVSLIPRRKKPAASSEVLDMSTSGAASSSTVSKKSRPIPGSPAGSANQRKRPRSPDPRC